MHTLKKITAGFLMLLAAGNTFSQSEKQVQLTTGIGINNVLGKLNKTFRSTVAFNSGFEKSFAKNWYGQIELNFNSLKYDQQVKDASSPYLFRNTSSSLFLLGVNWGYNFPLGKSPWFASLYTGSGYLNIGKPRVNLDELTNVVTQSVIRKNGIIGKGGARVGVKTNSGLFQTIYIDGSWLTSSFKADGSVFRSAAFFIGTRMSMGNNKALKSQMKSVRLLR